jgi:hypothetical protein
VPPLAAISGPTAFWLVVVVGSAIWVGFDASQRDFTGDKFGSSTAVWVVGTLVLWIVVLPVYLFKRGKAPKIGAAPAANRPPSSGGWSPPPPPPPTGPPASSGPPANWYPDPRGERRVRYWDGGAWTEHVSD